MRVRVHQPHDLAGRSDAGTRRMAVAIALVEHILRQHSVDPSVSLVMLRGVRHWLHVFYRPKVAPTRGLGSIPTYVKRARPMPMAEPCTLKHFRLAASALMRHVRALAAILTHAGDAESPVGGNSDVGAAAARQHVRRSGSRIARQLLPGCHRVRAVSSPRSATSRPSIPTRGAPSCACGSPLPWRAPSSSTSCPTTATSSVACAGPRSRRRAKTSPASRASAEPGSPLETERWCC